MFLFFCSLGKESGSGSGRNNDGSGSGMPKHIGVYGSGSGYTTLATGLDMPIGYSCYLTKSASFHFLPAASGEVDER